MKHQKIISFEARKKEVEYLRLACELSGIHIDYESADLLNDITVLLKRKKGKVTLEDCCRVKTKHEERWRGFRDNE